ncbi:hypothetical protein EON67_04000 [archaeon]|nr:MAG: hypothetical protein EON67_04000 [archaeon]
MRALPVCRPQVPSALFFKYNTALGPPYHILLDTNFINFAIKNKLEIVSAAMDCLLAKCIPCITDCVMAELEKLGPKFRIALRYDCVLTCMRACVRVQIVNRAPKLTRSVWCLHARRVPRPRADVLVHACVCVQHCKGPAL